MTRERAIEAALPDRIVVGVDGEGRSDPAVRTALELGRRLCAPVELVHAVPKLPDAWPGLDPARGAARSTELLERATRALDRRLRPFLEQAEREIHGRPGGAGPALAAPPRPATLRLVQGPAAKVLVDAARGSRNGWILLGGHAQRPFPDFGSTLRTLFAVASVPVWVQVPPAAPIRRILVPVDLSQESLSALATACALARAFGARVRAVYWFHLSAFPAAASTESPNFAMPYPLHDVRRSDHEAFVQAMQAFPWKDTDHVTGFVDGEPAAGILDASADADLVVVGSHGRTGLASVVLGGIAYRVLKRSEKAVLVVRAARRSFEIS